jgi:hypothetical protein
VGYVLFANLMLLAATIPDIRGIMDRRRRGISDDFAQTMEMTPMGRGIKRMGVRLGLMKDE